MARPIEWGRLLRLSLMPTAIADAIAGAVLGQAGSWPGTATLLYMVGASLGIYHGAMALNDWADRKSDARERPERPLPSGSISPTGALIAAVLCTAAGLACAVQLGTTMVVWYAILAVMAWAYDLVGRGPLRGPLLLAACRAGNLAAGLVLASQGASALPDTLWLLPAAYGLYVFSLSRIGRMEDGEEAIRPAGIRFGLRLCAALLCTPGILALDLGTYVFVAFLIPMGLGAGWALSLMSRRRGAWDAAAIRPVMGVLLRRMLLFSTFCCAVPGTTLAWTVAGCLLLGYPLAHALRRVFPPS